MSQKLIQMRHWLCFLVKPMLRFSADLPWMPIKNDNETSFQISALGLSKWHLRFFWTIFLRLDSILDRSESLEFWTASHRWRWPIFVVYNNTFCQVGKERKPSREVFCDTANTYLIRIVRRKKKKKIWTSNRNIFFCILWLPFFPNFL